MNHANIVFVETNGTFRTICITVKNLTLNTILLYILNEVLYFAKFLMGHSGSIILAKLTKFGINWTPCFTSFYKFHFFLQKIDKAGCFSCVCHKVVFEDLMKTWKKLLIFIFNKVYTIPTISNYPKIPFWIQIWLRSCQNHKTPCLMYT